MSYLPSVCFTPDCINAASDILQNLVPNYQSIDPCEDFDQYVCGGFPTRFPDKKNSRAGDLATIKNIYLLQTLLDSPLTDDYESSPESTDIVTKLKENYMACMDTETIQKEAESGPRAIYNHIHSLFPVSDEDSSSNATLSVNDYHHLLDLQVYLNTLEVDLFASYVANSLDTDPATIVPIVIPSAPRSTSYDKSPSPLGAKNSTELVGLLKMYLPSTLAQNSAEDLLSSVLALDSDILSLASGLDDGTPAQVPWNETTPLAPALSIGEVLKALVPKDYELTHAILVPALTSALSEIIDRTPKSVILAYALLKTSLALDPITVMTNREDPWLERCLNHVTETMPWVVSKLFVDAFYDEEATKSVDEFFEDLRATFIDRLDTVEWMEEATRAVAKEKASKIKKNIAYPREFPDTSNATDLRAFYEGLAIGPSHFNNTISFYHWSSQKSWDQLVRRTPQWLLDDVSYQVNAHYVPSRNEIYFPAGILRAPFFTTSLPQYVVYGALGFVSAHEITHGFDNTGRLYSETGALDPTQWDNKTLIAFEQRTQCFVDQFDTFELHADYPVAGSVAVDPKTNQTLYVNGTITLGENIADNGGIETSYAAWNKRRAVEPEKNPKLPGLEDFTLEQLFFLSFGQFFCHNSDAANLASSVQENHSPNGARIRAVMENSKDFRQAFNCKKQEPVCTMW